MKLPTTQQVSDLAVMVLFGLFVGATFAQRYSASDSLFMLVFVIGAFAGLHLVKLLRALEAYLTRRI